jgi:uncharacterized membrane protein (DUF485 family)
VDSVKLSGPEVASVAWIDSVQSAEFNTLIDAKRRSIVPMIVIYVVGYMGLSVLAGFGRGILSVKVLRPINLGFALIGPAYLGAGAIWPLVNPTVVALPLGILGAVLGSLIAGRNHEHERCFDEVKFRIQTGLRSDRPSAPSAKSLAGYGTQATGWCAHGH